MLTPALFLQRGAQASLVLVFFAFPMSVALANVALLLTLVFWLLGCVWGHSLRDARQALSNPITLPALAMFIWILFAASWSPADGHDILAAIQKYLKFLLVPVFIALLQDAATRRRCWQAFALALLFTLTITWLNVWFDFSWTRTHNQGFGMDHTVFKDYIAQGIMMSFFTVLVTWKALRSPRPAMAWLCAGIAGLAAFSVLFLSDGRTGYLALLMGMAAFGMFAVGRSPLKLGLIAAAGAIALVLAFTISSKLQNRVALALDQAEQSSISHPVTSVGARVEMARFVLDATLDAPVMGHGTASYPTMAKAYFTDTSWCNVVCVHPHNQFLFFLFEFGLIGLGLFLWFVLAIVRQACREAPPERALMMGFVAVMVAANVSHSSFWLSTESHFFFLMSALLMAGAHLRDASGARAA